jgi:hypothetical protein
MISKSMLKPIAATGFTLALALLTMAMNSYAGAIVDSIDEKKTVVQPEEKIDWGKINVNIRLRYEYADDMVLFGPSNAFTGRLRLGYTTPVLWGFQAMAEFEGTGTPDESSYRAANISGPASKTNVPDPQSYELNRLWLSYTAYETMVKAGRQRIIYDNARFVGNVGWRQNEQTFDAARFQSKLIPNLTLGYSYVNRVERIFGSESFGPTSDFQSDSHLINVNYEVADWLSFTVYTYLLDLHNIDIDIGSKTFGGFAIGTYPFNEKFSLSYRAEYANQSDWRSPASFDTNYVHAYLKGTYSGWSLEGGFELLGSDGGTAAFQTPLGTNHAFNGWADRFLVTPNTGLRDYYVGIGTKLPWEIGTGVIYHYFTDDRSGDEYGQEIDAYLKKDFGKGFSALAKFAYYFGDKGAFPPGFQNDTVKAWFQIEYNY